MSQRDRSSDTSWASWYAHQTDEVGTETFPAFENYATPVAQLPVCLNCGQVAEAATDRCEACWAKLVKP